MRRYLILAIVGIVIGKLFVSAIVSLTENTQHSPSHFFEKGLDAHMSLGPIPDSSNDNSPKMPPVNFHADTLIAQNILKPGSPSVAAATAAAAAKKAKAEADKKKADEDDKKRKKKLEEDKAKAEAAAKNVTVQAPQITVTTPQSPTADGNVGFQGPITPYPAATPVPVGSGGGGGGGSVANISGWMEALVNRPTAALMTAFVNLYHNRQITAAQYYQVLTAMQRSLVLLAREDAVQAAEMQPSSQAFQILADESVTETDATTRATAAQGLSAYNNVNDLSYLSQALTSGDVNSKMAAATALGSIVSSYSGKSNASTTQSLFMPFVRILKAITVSAVPPTLQADAQSVLVQIDSLLGIASI